MDVGQSSTTCSCSTPLDLAVCVCVHGTKFDNYISGILDGCGGGGHDAIFPSLPLQPPPPPPPEINCYKCILYDSSVMSTFPPDRLQKVLREFNKHVDKLTGSLHLGGSWDSSEINLLDRSLGEMRRTLKGGGTSDQFCFSHLGGLASVLKMLLLCSELPSLANGGQSGSGQGRGRPRLPEK